MLPRDRAIIKAVLGQASCEVRCHCSAVVGAAAPLLPPRAKMVDGEDTGATPASFLADDAGAARDGVASHAETEETVPVPVIFWSILSYMTWITANRATT